MRIGLILLYKLENLPLDPQHPGKRWMWWQIYNRCAQRQILTAHHPASVAKVVSPGFVRDPAPEKIRWRAKEISRYQKQ